MAFYSNHHKNYSINPIEVENELIALEIKGKRGKDINRKEMAELSRKAQEKREKEFERFNKKFEEGNLEELNKISDMYLSKQRKENMINKMNKQRNQELQAKFGDKKDQRKTKYDEFVKNSKWGNDELNEKVMGKLNKAQDNLDM